MQLGNAKPMRKTQETASCTKQALSWDILQHPYSSSVHTQSSITLAHSHTILGYSVLRGPTLMLHEER